MKSNTARLEVIKAAAERRRQMNYELTGMLSLDVLPDEPIPAGGYLVHNHVRPQKKAHGAIPSHHVHHVIKSVASHTRSKMTRFASKRYYALAEYVSHRPGTYLEFMRSTFREFQPRPGDQIGREGLKPRLRWVGIAPSPALQHGLQAYLKTATSRHTVRYTELSPGRFKDFWR